MRVDLQVTYHRIIIRRISLDQGSSHAVPGRDVVFSVLSWLSDWTMNVRDLVNETGPEGGQSVRSLPVTDINSR